MPPARILESHPLDLPLGREDSQSRVDRESGEVGRKRGKEEEVKWEETRERLNSLLHDFWLIKSQSLKYTN